VFCQRRRRRHSVNLSQQQIWMKKFSNDKEYAGRNLYKTNFHLPLGLNCANVVFRVYTYAGRWTSRSWVGNSGFYSANTNAWAKADFWKSDFHGTPLQDESRYSRLTILFCFRDSKQLKRCVESFKLYLIKIYVNWSEINNFASCFVAEFFPLRERLLMRRLLETR